MCLGKIFSSSYKFASTIFAEYFQQNAPVVQYYYLTYWQTQSLSDNFLLVGFPLLFTKYESTNTFSLSHTITSCHRHYHLLPQTLLLSAKQKVLPNTITSCYGHYYFLPKKEYSKQRHYYFLPKATLLPATETIISCHRPYYFLPQTLFLTQTQVLPATYTFISYKGLYYFLTLFLTQTL